MSHRDMEEEDLNVSRKLNVYKHIKKKAANDAQLLMNRIALIQKEEERAKKKIDQTKDKAQEILELRNETERRAKEFSDANVKLKQIQEVRLAKNREQDGEGKKARAIKLDAVRRKKEEDVKELQTEKKYLNQLILQEKEKEIFTKQKKREEIKRSEEEMKLKKEDEERLKQRKMKEVYEQRLKEEAAEAKRAEKLVKALEKQEREWIDRLKKAQEVQEAAFEQLEVALIKDNRGPGPGPSSSSRGGSVASKPKNSKKGSVAANNRERESKNSGREGFGTKGPEYEESKGGEVSDSFSKMNIANGSSISAESSSSGGSKKKVVKNRDY